MTLDEQDKRIRGPEKGSAVRRPTPRWKLRDSIRYIRRRDRWLEEQGILVKTGDREYRLNQERKR